MRRLAIRVLFLAALVIAFLGAAVLGSAALDRPSTTVHEEQIVEAPRSLVWQLLTNFDGYETWNPYITSAHGEARVGAEVDFHLEPRSGEPNDIECEVLDVKLMRKLRWRCRTYAPGVLDREHAFRVIPLGPDRFRLVYEGRWEGVLVPFADLDDRKRGYVRMADALRKRAERSS